MSRIMIIDDDIEFAQNTAAVLNGMGHETTLLHTTANAISLIIQNKPDLLILDVMFPSSPVAGFDLAREIRRHSELKGLPILMLTSVNQEFPMGFSNNDIDSDWMPIQRFIEKPFVSSELIQSIAQMLAAPRKE